MHAVVLTGHGGDDRLSYRDDVPIPVPGPLDVLVEVEAASLNNTDVNVRVDWYEGKDGEHALRFPRIQGADLVGRIVGVGALVADTRVGERVLCDPHLRDGASRRPERSMTAGYLGVDRDGGFAQYTCVPAGSAWRVPEHLPATELACYPVAWSTALEMILRAGVRAGHRVLVTGAGGGVGTALVQLGQVLGIEVVGVCSAGKAERLRELGAAVTVDRAAPDLPAAVRAAGVTEVAAVLDVVGGRTLSGLMGLIAPGGTCVTAGGIGGAVAPLDLRTLIYADLDLRGVSTPRVSTFAMLVDLVAGGAVHPVVAAVHPLAEFVTAQRRFTGRGHIGKFVVTPPPVGA